MLSSSTANVQGEAPKRIGLLILPQFSMMALAGASEPLRAANRLAGKTLYQWSLLSEAGGTVSSSSGVEINTQSLEEAPELDRVFVLASLDIEHQRPPKMIRFLHRSVAKGKTVGAFSTGTFILARAGLLEGKKCTLHWESINQFAEEFPTIEVTRELYVNHDNRWTCAGGTAAIDLMLAQISVDYGGKLAAAVAEQFLHARIRGPEEQQRMSIQWRFGVHDRRITAAIAQMEDNFEHVISIEQVAQVCNLSQRQLERLWHQHFGMTPQRFYLELRLAEARRMLRESTKSIASIAYSCGFVSASHLGSAYRKAWGCSPGEERRKFDMGQA
ncbi:GlxA family transcriptional regulator [Pseudomonas guariconensis]|uniref:GlxA family transcriptional regulator n=1 Tax=Pseudomonas TaxID=286 RepID=UPI001CE3B77F|nr:MULTISPECIES: GlxA family transcriptional regulator [Pseudomonas]MCO7638265.1 GlxA family transcriptional regulator [Pseudomonas sp. S 311-6]MCO7514164.1 GlxA family transcriptional regulator [Pseudomonas putida]MCO7564327.1 GlxA family transcriptional regulator [Pseudomonas mosselii]MCO7593677.1 GlxA family transcriptional regulator [Pseudomonas guariconensis]MCO7605217.1 GlxA family transcriptional regulator [Pseudomonas guariconensis]